MQIVRYRAQECISNDENVFSPGRGEPIRTPLARQVETLGSVCAERALLAVSVGAQLVAVAALLTALGLVNRLLRDVRESL